MLKRIINGIRHSMTARLFLVFLSVWSIFSFAVLAVLFSANSRMTDKIAEDQEDKIRYYSAAIGAEMDRITVLLENMCTDSDVGEFLQERSESFSYSDYEAYLRSRDKLKSYWSASPYITDAFVVLSDENGLLKGEQGVISVPEAYKEPIRKCLDGESETFFSVDDRMICLSRGAGGMVVGIELSARSVKSNLEQLGTGYFNCFLMEESTGELLGKSSVSQEGKAVYEEIRKQQEADQSGTGSDQSSAESGTGKEINGRVTVNGTDFLYESIQTPGNNFSLLLYVKEDVVYADLYFFRNFWIVLTALVLIIPLFIGFSMNRMLNRPLSQLVKAMKAVEERNYRYHLEENEAAEFNYVFRQFNNMTGQLEKLIREVYERQVQAEQARRRQLQAQINPHFLFNSFYMGYRMAKSGESDRVANLCLYLGDYFKILTCISDDYIRLDQELRFAEMYLKLNVMRFEDKLEYEISMEEGLGDRRVFPLLLQPIVENAVRHGVEKVQRSCRIAVHVKRKGSFMEFLVEDNCGMMDDGMCEKLKKITDQETMPKESFGLWNIENRLRLLKGGTGGLTFERRGEYFRVSFLFPLEVGEQREPTKEASYPHPEEGEEHVQHSYSG